MPARHRFTLHLVAMCVAAIAQTAFAADPAPLDPAPEDAAAQPVIEPNTQAIEAVIAGLSRPVADEQVVAILTAIGQLPDPKEQERLRQTLNDKGHELLQDAATSSGQPTLNPESSDHEFRARIDALQLSADATAADFRARDEVVSAIVGVSDPTRREELLKALEARERQAETLVEPPVTR